MRDRARRRRSDCRWDGSPDQDPRRSGASPSLAASPPNPSRGGHVPLAVRQGCFRRRQGGGHRCAARECRPQRRAARPCRGRQRSREWCCSCRRPSRSRAPTPPAVSIDCEAGWPRPSRWCHTAPNPRRGQSPLRRAEKGRTRRESGDRRVPGNPEHRPRRPRPASSDCHRAPEGEFPLWHPRRPRGCRHRETGRTYRALLERAPPGRSTSGSREAGRHALEPSLRCDLLAACGRQPRAPRSGWWMPTGWAARNPGHSRRRPEWPPESGQGSSALRRDRRERPGAAGSRACLLLSGRRGPGSRSPVPCRSA